MTSSSRSTLWIWQGRFRISASSTKMSKLQVFKNDSNFLGVFTAESEASFRSFVYKQLLEGRQFLRWDLTRGRFYMVSDFEFCLVKSRHYHFSRIWDELRKLEEDIKKDWVLEKLSKVYQNSELLLVSFRLQLIWSCDVSVRYLQNWGVMLIAFIYHFCQ